MGYDLFGAIGFAIITPLVIAGFIAFWILTNHERKQLEDTWRVFAAARGRDYEEATGEWPNRTSPAVQWHAEDVTYRLESRGREARAFTRLVARPTASVLGLVRIRADHGHIARASVRIAHSLVTAELEKRLMAFSHGDSVLFTYRRGRFVLEWPGREENDARIAEGKRVLDAAVDAVRAAFA